MPRTDGPKAKLGWLIDGEFHIGAHDGPNRVAADSIVTQLRLLQRTERIDEAQLVAFSMLAEAVDLDPTNASLWAQYRAAEVAMRRVGVNGEDDAFDKLLAELSTAVPDAPELEPRDSGGGRRQGGASARVSVAAMATTRRRRGERDPA